MPYSATIAGSTVFVVGGSLTFSRSVGRRSQASFNVQTDTSTHFQMDMEVEIFDGNGTLVFGGYLNTPKEQLDAFEGGVLLQRRHRGQLCSVSAGPIKIGLRGAPSIGSMLKVTPVSGFSNCKSLEWISTEPTTQSSPHWSRMPAARRAKSAAWSDSRRPQPSGGSSAWSAPG